MVEGPSVDDHHLVPKCRGGRETKLMHRVCHNKVHSVFSEKQLEKDFSTVDDLLADEQIQKFVAWVQKKEPEFYDKNEDTAARKRRRH